MNLYFAPIHGLTLAYYRNLHEEIFGGFDAYYAPFIGTTEIDRTGMNMFRDLFLDKNTVHKLIPQLLSNKGQDFYDYALLLSDMGYDEINLNIGCPFKGVTNKKRGAGLLPYPDLLEAFLEKVCGHDSFKFTLKMRLGMTHLEEGLRILDLINRYPIHKVIVHGRLGIQKYEGQVDLNGFDVFYENLRHPLVYNGDIFTVEDFKSLQDRYPRVNEFMLGRGVLRDPFLGARLKGQTFEAREAYEKLRAFHDGIMSYHLTCQVKEAQLLNKMKEFWSYVAMSLDPSGMSLTSIQLITNQETYDQTIDRFLRQHFGI